MQKGRRSSPFALWGNEFSKRYSAVSQWEPSAGQRRILPPRANLGVSAYPLTPPRKKGDVRLPCVAEREGFEPPEAFTSTVFKTAAFDRSAISPKICSQKIFCYAKSFSVRFYFVVKWLNGWTKFNLAIFRRYCFLYVRRYSGFQLCRGSAQSVETAVRFISYACQKLYHFNK